MTQRTRLAISTSKILSRRLRAFSLMTNLIRALFRACSSTRASFRQEMAKNRTTPHYKKVKLRFVGHKNLGKKKLSRTLTSKSLRRCSGVTSLGSRTPRYKQVKNSFVGHKNSGHKLTTRAHPVTLVHKTKVKEI